MKKTEGLLFLLLTVSFSVTGQKYVIRLANKGASSFTLSDPSAYLSQRAIDRRNRYGIALDSTDLPVTPGYLDSIASVAGVTILNASKWLNQVSVQVSGPAALNRINSFPFVQGSTEIASRIQENDRLHHTAVLSEWERNSSAGSNSVKGTENHTSDYFDYGNSYKQIHLHNGEFLHNIGLRGQNMVIGMLDNGFRAYTSLKAFDSVVANNQILGTWDFVSGNANVTDDHAHGMQCFSIIAANIPGSFTGSAPKANFYLFRTENVSTEYPIEEHDWVCAAERLDSVGGDVISSSVGYTVFDKSKHDHSYTDLNGNRTTAAIGADLAVRKGLLVVNAIGNSGDDDWKYLATPADGDSVLAVGAVAANGQVGSFSSYGPSSDGQIKPDVVSLGVGAAYQHTNNRIGIGNGTSFACPNMAGLATCIWQGFPEVNNMAIVNALRQSGNNTARPDDRIGYGIPDSKKAILMLLKQTAAAEVRVANCRATLQWTSKDMAAMKYEIERKAPGDSVYSKFAEQSGSGAVFSTHNYSLTDILSSVKAGTISYRIRQILDTAAASFTADYIDTVSVTLNPSCALADQINIMPNPTGEQFVLQTAFDEAVSNLQILIVNSIGQVVFRKKESKPQGTVNYPIHIPYLASGIYYVHVYKEADLMQTKEFIKLP